MRIVFDLDDTICRHTKRDFANAKPIIDTINRIKELKGHGCEVVIYTARGQNSCAGNIAKIEAKYRADIVRWLNENDVPFDELIFGKPLGDLYVDDKGVNLSDFLKMDFETLKGHSGSGVFKAGEVVVKSCKNPWEQSTWLQKATEYGVNTPKVYSVVLDNISMEYIQSEGIKADKQTLYKLLSYPLLFKEIKDGEFKTEKLIERVQEHVQDRADFSKTFWHLTQSDLESDASFCHGDYTISNCLQKDGKIYLIDPNQNPEYSSWLLDLAKLRFSINGGELFLTGKNFDETGEIFLLYDKILKQMNVWQKVIALEVTHWLRLIKYTDRVNEVIQKAKSLEGLLW